MDIPKKRKARERLLNSLQKPNGEWNRRGLEKIGVGWPPRRGWQQAFIQFGEDWEKYV